MSIAYQSWEIGSGPTVGFKLQPHQAPGDGLKNLRKLIYRPAAPPPAPGASTLMSLPPTSSPKARFEDSTRLSPGSNSSSSSSEQQQQQRDDDDAPMPCSSSSIVTSSLSGSSTELDDDQEVESPFKGPLEQMDTLMTTLPIRRSISKFYTGKSRSFTSLADMKSISMKDLAKPENPYAKRRRIPSHREDKPRFPPPRVSTGISKKPISSTGTTLTLAVAMSTRADGVDNENCSVASGNKWQKSCRSFSLTDLQKA